MKKLKFERKETKKQQSSGITLIALVITIVLNATRGHCEECIA